MATTAPERKFTVVQASFIGVGAMVGAGIFALLGAAGAVAGSAVWLSFLVAGAIAMLQGYSFSKLGAIYPSAAGMLEYLGRGFGPGHITGVTSWLLYAANAVVAAMVAVSFGSYASAVVAGESATWAKVFACLIILAMTALNIMGSSAVARVQSLLVKAVISILAIFAVVTLLNMDPSLLAPSGYPGAREIVSSIALTFFAFLGFGVITFTAKDLPDPARQLPPGNVPCPWHRHHGVRRRRPRRVRHADRRRGDRLGWHRARRGCEADTGPVRVRPHGHHGSVLHDGGRELQSVPVHRSDPAARLDRSVPTVFGRSLGQRKAPVGLLVMAGATVVLAVFFDLNGIASLGSAVALIVFSMVTFAHFRVRHETGARLWVLIIAVISTLGTLLVFCTTTLVDEPVTALALVVILGLSILVDLLWTRTRDHRRAQAQAA